MQCIMSPLTLCQKSQHSKHSVMFKDDFVSDLLVDIRHQMGWLLNASDSIALLDILVNFADLVTQNEGWVRGLLSENASY